MKNRRRTVLIAENNRAIARLMRLHLERAGYCVFVAHDGEQASILAARQRFELIFANLDLPIMSGIEFCRHIREDLCLVDVPIAVCLSPAMDESANDLMFRYGITRTFVPPIDPEAILEFARETTEYAVATN